MNLLHENVRSNSIIFLSPFFQLALPKHTTISRRTVWDHTTRCWVGSWISRLWGVHHLEFAQGLRHSGPRHQFFSGGSFWVWKTGWVGEGVRVIFWCLHVGCRFFMAFVSRILGKTHTLLVGFCLDVLSAFWNHEFKMLYWWLSCFCDQTNGVLPRTQCLVVPMVSL